MAKSRARFFADLVGVNNLFDEQTSLVKNDVITPTGTQTGTFGSASEIPVITVSSDGRITNIANTVVAGVTGVTFYSGNNTLRIATADGSEFDTAVDVSDKATWNALISTNTALRTVISDRMQVANVEAYLANTNAYIAAAIATELSHLANTNAYIASTAATGASNLANTNAYIASVSATERGALANTNAYIATKVDASTFNAALANTNAFISSVSSTERSALANTNAYIATKVNTSTFNSALANTNAYISSVSAAERSALANTNAYIASTASTELSHLANTNSYIAGVNASKASWSALQGTNTAIRTLVSDRIQVANAVSTFATWSALTATNTSIRSAISSEVASLVDSAPTTLDTLNELAAALGDDPNFATTLTTNLGQKLGSTASVTLTGDVSGSGSFSSNAVSISVTVADDSHTHDGRYIPKGGSWNGANMPGSRWDGFSVNGGEVVFQRDNPNNGQMSVMVDGNFYAGENNGFWSLYSFNDYNYKVGFTSNLSGHFVISTPNVYAAGNKIWHAGNDGSGSGLDADLLDGQHGSYYYSAGNPPPYPAEADTLATVTARGASTSNSVTLSGNSNHFKGHFYFDPYDAAGNHYPHFLDGSSNGGVDINWRLYTGATNSHTHIWNTTTAQFATKLESTVRVDAPIFYDRDNTAYYLDPASTSVVNIMDMRNTAKISYAGYAGIEYYNTAGGQWQGYIGTESNSGNLRFNSYNGNHNWYSNSSGIATLNSTRLRLGNPNGNPATAITSSLGRYLEIAINDANSTSYTYGSGVVFHHGGVSTSALSYMQPDANAGYFYFNSDDSSYQGVISTSSMRAPIFYDSNNTGYYVNPASTSNINTLNVATINRNPTVTLSGDVTGSATMTNLGSINITTVVGNDSHTHDTRYLQKAGDTATGKITFSGGLEGQAIYLSGAQNFDNIKTSGFYSLYNVNAAGNVNAPIQYGTMLSINNTAVGGGMGMQLVHERTNGGTYIRGMNDTADTWYGWQRIFMDNYHPNADKWTTARTLSLTGDVTGSVSWDGSGNASMSTTVGNDSHSHSNYVTTTYNSSLNSDSRNSRGVTRLYRRDSDSDYSVQTYWTGSYWRLYGYYGDSGHADVHVGYADSAGNADTVDSLHASQFLRSDASDTGTGEYSLTNKRQNIGQSSSWDSVGFAAQTNLHFQGHNYFWVGAGNGTWFTGAANSKSQASGLAADASYAHDLLLSTMVSDASHDRGITFAVDNTGAGNSGWRLGKWHSGTGQTNSMLAVDGQLVAKGGHTDFYDFYANDYSAYYGTGQAHWSGDSNSGWHKPSIVASKAIQIQSGNAGTNSDKPQIQFHQYGYGGPGIEYDGPNKLMTFGELGTSNGDRVNTFEFRFDNTIRARINSDYMFHNSDMRSPIFYDSNNTGYYADPASTSRFANLVVDRVSGLTGSNDYKEIYVYGDANTYYPVIIAGQAAYTFGMYGVDRHYGATAPSTWNTSTHKGGLTFNFMWSGDPAWGGNDHSVRVIQFSQTYSTMVAGLALPVSGGVCVWLRGGTAVYKIRTPLGYNAGVTVYDGYSGADHSTSTTYTAGNGATYSARTDTSNVASEINARMPISGNSNLFDNGNRVIDQGSGDQTKSGYLQSNSSLRSPIFYDSNNTGYYADPASTSVFNDFRCDIMYDKDNTAYYVRPGSTSIFNDARANIWYSRSNTGYYSDPESTSNLNVTQTSSLYLSSSTYRFSNNEWAGTAGYPGYTYSGGDHRFGFSSTSGKVDVWSDGIMYALESHRAPIFYDYNDTAWYTDPASTSKMRNIDVCSGTNTANYYDAAIEVREYNMGGAQTDNWQTAPRIGFHWGGRVASSIAMSSNGWINIMNNPGTGYESFRAANIYATGNVTAYYSDERLKTKVGVIDNAINKVKSIETFLYVNNELAKEKGFTNDDVQVGLSAQSVEKVLPEVVKHAPFDMVSVEGKIESVSGEWYKTVQYERVVPLLIEAIKEQQTEIDDLKSTINILVNKLNKLID